MAPLMALIKDHGAVLDEEDPSDLGVSSGMHYHGDVNPSSTFMLRSCQTGLRFGTVFVDLVCHQDGTVSARVNPTV